MPPERVPREVFWACPSRRRPRGRPRTHWRDYIPRLAWEHLGVSLEGLVDVAGKKSVWISLLKLLPPAIWTWIRGRKWMKEYNFFWLHFSIRTQKLFNICPMLQIFFFFFFNQSIIQKPCNGIGIRQRQRYGRPTVHPDTRMDSWITILWYLDQRDCTICD